RWIHLGNLLPHLYINFLRTVGLDDIVEDEEFDAEPMGKVVPERFRTRILEHMQTRTEKEWMELFIEGGNIAGHPYQTTQEALHDPDVTANGHAVVAHGRRQLGLSANLTRTPGEIGAPATDTTLDALGIHTPTAPNAGSAHKLPLEGVTVVESATIIASPLGASLLADLGARVIKLEPITGDPFRSMGAGFGAARCNTGKESIALNLKDPKAREIAQTIISKADIFIHNYRPGVPERLGLDYDSLSALNPGLVYLSVNGYGPNGPGSHRPSTHPIPGAAMGGVTYQVGELPQGELSIDEITQVARRLMRANEVNPDPNTSMMVASAAMMGLAARERGDKAGQLIYLDMFGASAYANFDDFLEHPEGSARPQLLDGLYGIHNLHRLYECKEGWVMLALAGNTDWQQFSALLENDSLSNIDFATACQADNVTEVLVSVMTARTADEWESLCVPKGIGCVRADGMLPGEKLYKDTFFHDNALALPSQHPEFGDILRHGRVVELGDKPDALPGPCALGDSTRSLLAEFGHSEEAVQILFDDGVVG
ncbi:MAG: CoA transferase, partial [Pseudomonadota bacterium]